MVAVEKNQPASIQNANETIRDALKLLKSRSAMLNPSVQQVIVAQASSFSVVFSVCMSGVAINW